MLHPCQVVRVELRHPSDVFCGVEFTRRHSFCCVGFVKNHFLLTMRSPSITKELAEIRRLLYHDLDCSCCECVWSLSAQRGDKREYAQKRKLYWVGTYCLVLLSFGPTLGFRGLSLISLLTILETTTGFGTVPDVNLLAS